MSDKKPPPPNHYFLALQEKEMRRLELGEARANEDWDRVSEINAEMKKDGITGIGYENNVADSAFGEFERREELRSQRDTEFEPTTPDRAPEADPQREPEQDPSQRQAQTPERQAAAAPERPQERDPDQRPIGRYDEMTQQHAEIVAKNSPQGQEQAWDKQLKFSEDRQHQSPEIVAQAETQQQAEPGEKQLRFSEDREQRDNSQGHNEERADAKQAEREESGEKKLSFFEDRNPAQSHEMEH
jgi:hypothetical protein